MINQIFAYSSIDDPGITLNLHLVGEVSARTLTLFQNTTQYPSTFCLVETWAEVEPNTIISIDLIDKFIQVISHGTELFSTPYDEVRAGNESDLTNLLLGLQFVGIPGSV